METRRRSGTLESLTQRIETAIEATVQKINQSGTHFIYPTFFPQRAELEVRLGIRDFTIIGGPPGDEAHPGIRQIGVPKLLDTRGIVESAENAAKIVAAIPKELLEDNKGVVVGSYEARNWETLIQLQHPGAKIVTSSGGNAKFFFEEKANLRKIMKMARLGKYLIDTITIPHRIRDNDRQLLLIYKQLKDKEGRIILQSMGTNFCESGGSKGTRVLIGPQQFIEEVRSSETDLKAVRFIEGQSSNLTLFAGNIVPSRTGWGATDASLPSGINVYNPDSLYTILKHARKQNVGNDTAWTIGGGSSLRGIGQYPLASKPVSSVGHIVMHQYAPLIQVQIQEIQSKLGTFLGLCGARTLINVDIIIQANGQVKVNEINFRPGGATAPMCAYASQKGIPSLKQIAFLSDYADFRKKDIQRLFRQIQQHSEEITRHYLAATGPFYLKFNTIHKETCRARQGFSTGTYVAHHDRQKGQWIWTREKRSQSEHLPSLSLGIRKEIIKMRIEGGKVIQGRQYPESIQLFRLTGIGPAFVEHGRLHPLLVKPIEDLYRQTFGEQVISGHPLRHSENS